jgi:L-lactate utilization protein LutB
VNERLAADIPALVKLARKELRTKFLNAEMGISGANIAVAETGSIVIITNEGNARLVTTLPQTHVAIVGVEKLVAHFEDVLPILTALPRSATAQLLTSYVSVITGPSPNPDGSLKNLHIVLMDNHRTDMSNDPAFREALQCIRCASCLNVCPVFRLVGGHVFGKTYTGGIGTILTAWFDELKMSEEIQGLCIQCGNCVDVCPGKVPIPDMILESSTTAACSTPCCARLPPCRSPLRRMASSATCPCSSRTCASFAAFRPWPASRFATAS